MTKVSGFFSSWIVRLFVAVVNIFAMVLFLALWIASWFTTWDSAFFVRTYSVWTYAPMLMPQLIGTALGLMLSLYWGANRITAVAVIVFDALGLIGTFFAMILYWRIGWNCSVKSGTGNLKGVDLAMCVNEEGYLITLWVIVTALTFLALFQTIGHILFFVQTAKANKISFKNPSKKKEKYGDDESSFDVEASMDDSGSKYNNRPASMSGGAAVRRAINSGTSYIKSTTHNNYASSPRRSMVSTRS